MASSSYYYNLYQEWEEKASKYQSEATELERIRAMLGDDTYVNIREVNSGISELEPEVKKAIQENFDFDVITQKINDFCEKKLGFDPYLSKADSKLESEIISLETKRRNAQQESDYYWREYERERERERAEEEAARARAIEEAAKQLIKKIKGK